MDKTCTWSCHASHHKFLKEYDQNQFYSLLWQDLGIGTSTTQSYDMVQENVTGTRGLVVLVTWLDSVFLGRIFLDTELTILTKALAAVLKLLNINRLVQRECGTERN